MESQDPLSTCQNLDAALSAIETHLAPYFAVPREETQATLAPIDQAKLNIVTAYSINTLYYIYLRTRGMNPNDHPVKQELERVKLYIKKIKELADTPDVPKEPNVRLNVDAAGRFIQHALAPTNSDSMDTTSSTSNNNSNSNATPKAQTSTSQRPTHSRQPSAGSAVQKSSTSKNEGGRQRHDGHHHHRKSSSNV